MLVKKMAKNQITLPKAIVQQIPSAEYFDVSIQGGAVLLRPVVVSVPGERLTVVREKLRALGLTEEDVRRAIRWARSRTR